jgi:hypothetical protein
MFITFSSESRPRLSQACPKRRWYTQHAVFITVMQIFAAIFAEIFKKHNILYYNPHHFDTVPAPVPSTGRKLLQG